MCLQAITCCLFFQNNYNVSSNGGTLDLLQRRGPDKSKSIELHVAKYKITFAASVLHMQGINVTEQPAVSNTGNLLLFNGEIFGGIEVQFSIMCKSLYLIETLLCLRKGIYDYIRKGETKKIFLRFIWSGILDLL